MLNAHKTLSFHPGAECLLSIVVRVPACIGLSSTFLIKSRLCERGGMAGSGFSTPNVFCSYCSGPSSIAAASKSHSRSRSSNLLSTGVRPVPTVMVVCVPYVSGQPMLLLRTPRPCLRPLSESVERPVMVVVVVVLRRFLRSERP